MGGRRRGRTPDAEVIDLFRDEPELLAVADAVAATQRPPRTRMVVTGGVLVAAAIAATASILVLAGGDNSLVDKALAAVGEAPVVHVVLEQEVPNDFVIQLRTGHVVPSRLRVESWFDSRTRSLQLVTRRNGRRVPATPEEAAAAGAQLASLDPATITFLRNYRRALRARQVRAASSSEPLLELGRGRTRGTVRLGPDFRPIAFAPSGRRSAWRVLVFRGETAVTQLPEPRILRRVRGEVLDQRRVPVASARRALGGRLLLARVSWLSRRSLLVQHLVRRDGHTSRSIGVRVRYSGRSSFLEISEARTPEPAYSFVDGQLTVGLDPIPPQASMAVHGSVDGGLWVGQLRSRNLFVTLRGSSRVLVVSAARSLYPGVA